MIINAPYVQRRLGLRRYLAADSLLRVLFTKSSTWNHLRLRNVSGSVLQLNTWDIATFIEVFADGEYNLLITQHTNHIRTIVDCGANVGLFANWCSFHFPKATIICHEPVERNRLLGTANTSGMDSVTWKNTAVSNKFGDVSFTDEGPGSTILWDGYTKDVQNNVDLVDLFDEYMDATIDILKMDIEGSELAILNDDRFVTWSKRIKVIALEWHNHGPIENLDAKQWYLNRLEHCGFKVYSGNEHGNWSGLIFGVRA